MGNKFVLVRHASQMGFVQASVRNPVYVVNVWGGIKYNDLGLSSGGRDTCWVW